MIKNKNKPSSKTISRKNDEPKVTVVVDENVPELPSEAPKKPKRAKLAIRDRVTKRAANTTKRILALAERVGLDADATKDIVLALSSLESHIKALPSDWKPAGGGGLRESFKLEVGQTVSLKPKFIEMFVDDETSVEDLAKLEVTKIYAEGKKVVVKTKGGDKLMLNAAQVTRAAA